MQNDLQRRRHAFEVEKYSNQHLNLSCMKQHIRLYYLIVAAGYVPQNSQKLKTLFQSILA